MRLQSIVNSNASLQITYIEEADIHEDSGIMIARTVDIPHPSLPQHLLDEVVDIAEQIIDFARVTQREPIEQFRAPR
jgi:hypothetical protein